MRHRATARDENLGRRDVRLFDRTALLGTAHRGLQPAFEVRPGLAMGEKSHLETYVLCRTQERYKDILVNYLERVLAPDSCQSETDRLLLGIHALKNVSHFQSDN